MTVYLPPAGRFVNLYVPSASVVVVAVLEPLRVIVTPPSPVLVPAFTTLPLMVKLAAFAVKLQAVWLSVRLLKVRLDGVKTKPSLEALTVYCPPEARLTNLYVPSESVVAVAVLEPLKLIVTPPSPAPLASVTRPEMERVVDGDGEGDGLAEGDGEGDGDGVGDDSFVLDESDFK